MWIRYLIFVAVLVWLDGIEGIKAVTENQSTRIRRSIEPVSLKNVSSVLARENYHRISTKGFHVNQEQGRGLRKINLLGNLFQKRQPLYLLNGTVCRFVNAVPICTTLSTTGVLPSSPAPGGSGGSGGSGGGRPPGAPTPSGQSSGQQGGQSTSNSPRPAALIEDDSEDINVNGLNTAQLLTNNDPNQVYQVNSGQQQQQQQQQQQPQLNQLNQQQVASSLTTASSNNINNNSNNNLQQQSTAIQPIQQAPPEARPFGYLVRRPGPFNLRRPQFQPISARPGGLNQS